MRTATPLQKAETIKGTKLAGPGISHPLLEPANCPSANPRQHDSRVPRLTKNLRHAPLTPNREHAFRISTTDKDHILVEEIASQIRSSFKERQMRRTATESQKCRIETDQITIRLGAGSRHKRHSSLRSIRLLKNVALQAEILRIAIESAAADGDDLTLSI